MFHTARITLTGWYLLILVLITTIFTGITYQVQTQELDFILQKQRAQKAEFEQLVVSPAPPLFDTHIELLEESKRRILRQILLGDLIIIVTAGIAAYFLAGKTLQPIEAMHEDQNRFISDASHELRTPLTVLRTELEVNLKDTNLTLDQAKHVLQSNHEEVLRLQSITDRLLSLIKNKSLPNHIMHTQNDVQKLMHQAIKKVQLLANSKNIAITDNTQQGIIEGNADALTEVFVILLDNAIKYSEQGQTVIVQSYKAKKSMIVVVKDQGIGINPDDLQHIFDRFYRANESRAKTQADGYGLGLAIAQKILNDHHGHISVTSTPGNGATFLVELPLTQ